MDNTTSAAPQRKMIRANPAQAAILKSALETTPTPTPEQIQMLSSETDLPTKWIHNWFGRQRVKINPARARTGGRRRVKQEALDAGEALACASSPTSAGASMSASASTSDCFSITASSSGATLASAPSAGEGSSRRKPGRPGKQQQDEQQDSTTMEKSGDAKRVLRSRGNRATKRSPPPPPAPTRRVKAEQIEAAAVESLRYTPPLVPIINASASAAPPPIMPPALPHRSATLLPRVGPPQRSPMGAPLPPIAGAGKARGPRSGLGQGVRTTYTRIAPVATGQAARPVAAARRRAPAPTFQNQFQHRGPADFILEGYQGQYADGGGGSGSNASGGNGAAHTPTAVEGFVPPRRVVNSHLQAQKQNRSGGEESAGVHGIARPLAPAFDWETHAPPQEALQWPRNYTSDINTGAPLAQEIVHGWDVYSTLWDVTNSALLATVPAGAEMHEQVPAGYVPSQATPLTVHEPIIHMETPPVLLPPLVPMSLVPPLQSFNPFHAQVQAQDPMLTDNGTAADALDPTRAPLKHLTEVLSAFRDERGGYARVLEPEQHGNLLRCLLDEALMPFEAAMGLAFLGRLGFQWGF